MGWLSYAAVYQLGLKRRKRFTIPILGIGNLEVGGTGKTPLTIAVARLLQGKNIAISCSAYGSVSSDSATLYGVEKPLDPERHGDEACLIRKKLPNIPLILGRDRVRAAQLAQENGFGALILDDGFQHLPLARTADVLVFDPNRKNWRALPAGPLREPAGGMRRASAFFVSHENGELPHPQFSYRLSFPFLRKLDTGERMPTQALADKRIAALCAIGNPQRFLRTLEQLGLLPEKTLIYPDHDNLRRVTLSHEYIWVVTEKDAVKLNAASTPNCYVLEMEACFCDEEAVERWLDRTLFH